LGFLVNYELKFAKSRIKPGKSVATTRRWFLLCTIAMLAFISFYLLTSLGQSLLKTGLNVTAKNGEKLAVDNAILSPLAQSSHLRNMPFSLGAHIVYSGNAMSAQDFAWSGRSNAKWWTSEYDDSPEEADSTPDIRSQAVPGKFAYQDLHPRLRTRTSDFPVMIRESNSVGIADLLTFLREKDLKRQFEREQDFSKENPFEEALKKASTEAGQAKGQESKGTESTAQAQAADTEADKSKAATENASKESQTAEDESEANKESASAEDESQTDPAGGPPAGAITFLFIGAFNNKLVATDVGTASLNQLNSQASSAIAFDLAGIGKQTFDTSIVLRSRINQESVAFGDLNLDGFPDLVVTRMSTNGALVYMNDKRGNYILTGEIYSGFGPAAAAISDYNRDGSPDVAIMLQTDRRIMVDGKLMRKFLPPISAINDEYSSMIPFDFNGDGLSDLLLTNYRTLTATIYLNRGMGSFVASSSSTLQSFPTLQSSVDLDVDGINDSVYVQYLGSQISIVVQNGRDGSISSLGNMMLDPAIYYILGDFNLDGVIDIAIARPNQ
jgi:hypothetical protein